MGRYPYCNGYLRHFIFAHRFKTLQKICILMTIYGSYSDSRTTQFMTFHVRALVLVQQLTHLVCASQSLPSLIKTFLRLSYRFGKIADKKKDRKTQENKKRKEKKAKKTFVSTESNGVIHSITLQGQTACFSRSKSSIIVAGNSAVSQTPCERRLVIL